MDTVSVQSVKKSFKLFCGIVCWDKIKSLLFEILCIPSGYPGSTVGASLAGLVCFVLGREDAKV